MQNLLLGNIPSHEKLHLVLPNYQLIDNVEKKIVTFGSCFASSVSRGLSRLGFQTYFAQEDSFHYSPSSIKQYFQQLTLKSAELEKYVTQIDDNRYRSIATRHISKPNENITSFCEHLSLLNKQMLQRLEEADFVVITFGNATFQKHRETQLTLCHGGGLATDSYDVIQSTYEEVLSDMKACLTYIRSINSKCSVILTLSPQRYGWLMNANLSTGINEILDLDKKTATDWLLNSNIDKAKLRLAIDSLIKENNLSNLYYFPAFEIVMDELRDYEGFNHDVKDLMHVSMPNTPNYVINRFLNSFCTNDLKEALAFFRSTIDILIDIYPSRLRKLSTHQATNYINEKLPIVSDYISKVSCNKLAGYVVNGMLEAFPDLVKDVITKKGLVNLNAYLKDSFLQKCAAIESINHEPVCIIGTGELLDKLCKHTPILNKNILGIVCTNTDNPRLFGLPVHKDLSLVQASNLVLIVINERLLEDFNINELQKKIII
jgi:hypothetical protein